jgi:membrane-associated phospholipid phosphatase
MERSLAESPTHPEPRPVDRLLGAYLLLAALALAFPHRPGGWAALLALHLGLGTFLLAGGPRRLQRLAARRLPAAGSRVARSVVEWYPLLLMPFLYWELPHLAGSLWGGRYFDGLVQAWEHQLFGHQPSTTWAAQWPSLALSEILHGAYLAYYPVIYGVPAILFFRGRLDAFRDTLFALMLTFVLAYLVFIVFPVQGPRYLFPAPGGALADGPLYRLTHAVLEGGSSQGAAFPSAHAAVAVVQAVNAHRHLPRALPLLVLILAGICAGAVFGGFHYAVDMVAGVGLGLLAASVAPTLRRGLVPGRAP